MFIEQSAARSSAVRVVFVLAGFVPCVALVAVAWWRHSPGHVARVTQAASAHLGLPVSAGAIVHPRPGVLRLAEVVVGGTSGGQVLVVPQMEVETAGGEVRVRVPRLECSPGAVRVLAEMAGEWLRRPTRFVDAWVLDVGEATWPVSAGAGGCVLGGWHVECVAVGDSRAMRCRREPPTADDVRVRTSPEGFVVEGSLGENVPLAMLAAVVPGAAPWADAAGGQAVMSGRIDARCGADGWSGSVAGTVEHVALDGLVAGNGSRMRAEATIAVANLQFVAGRIVACDMLVSATAGTLPQTMLDGLVSNLGCRPGPAYRAIGGDVTRRFDRLACRIVLEGGVLRIGSVEGGGGALLVAQGLSVLDEPAAAVPATRLAWFLSPEGRPAVPATPASAWLMSVLPDAGAF